MKLSKPIGAVSLALALLAGCSSGGGGTVAADQPADGVPGNEVTSVTDPAQEVTGSSEATEPVNRTVSVELPGLPVGGSGAEFSEPSLQCVDVNFTGDPLPDGVVVVITGFSVPPEFSVSSGPCGSAPPCLGTQLNADTGCQVGVTWTGQPLADGEVGELAVATATATCADQSLCEQAIETITSTGLQTIELFVTVQDVSPDGTDDSGTPDVNGETVTPDDSSPSGESSSSQ